MAHTGRGSKPGAQGRTALPTADGAAVADKRHSFRWPRADTRYSGRAWRPPGCGLQSILENRVSDSDIDLQIGDMMQLELGLDNSSTRHMVRAIGMLPGASILVTSPMRNGKILPVREGQPVVMRCFARNHASAFSARVLRSATHPYPYLHLSFPDQTQDVVVRNSRRIEVKLIAIARVQRTAGQADELIAATIGDLSTSGAMLETPVSLGPQGTKLKISVKLPVDGIGEREIAIDCIVRSRHEIEGGAGRHSHGVEFLALDPLQTLTLRAYVYGQLLTS